MQNFIYPATLFEDKVQGGFVVRFTDLPEAITQGNTVQEALKEAIDCLEEAIANRIVMNLEIPAPSIHTEGQHLVPLPAQMAAKAALYLALKESGMTNVEFAKRFGCDEKEVRRLLDPRHPSKLPRIESALSVMGKRIVVGVQTAA